MRRMLGIVAISVLPLAVSGWADVLHLRDGSAHTGRFVSGTGSTIVFQEDSGARRSYNLRDVQSLEFESNRVAMNNRAAVNTDQASASGQRVIPAGSELVVRTTQAIDSTSASEGTTYPATVSSDVTDQNGNVLVPRGSEAELVVRQANQGGTTGSAELALDLESLRVGNQRYLVSSAPVQQSNQQGLGKNKRTGEYVGGGAAIGSILGAIAGGGKGAAIGAVAGAAAGAGAQVLTRGKEVKVPAETNLTFKLDKPINLVPSR